MKPGKVLRCVLFLLAILRVDPALKLIKCKRLMCAHLEALRLCNSCLVYEHNSKEV